MCLINTLDTPQATWHPRFDLMLRPTGQLHDRRSRRRISAAPSPGIATVPCHFSSVCNTCVTLSHVGNQPACEPLSQHRVSQATAKVSASTSLGGMFHHKPGSLGYGCTGVCTFSHHAAHSANPRNFARTCLHPLRITGESCNLRSAASKFSRNPRSLVCKAQSLNQHFSTTVNRMCDAPNSQQGTTSRQNLTNVLKMKEWLLRQPRTCLGSCSPQTCLEGSLS